jgi:endonuclease I
MSRRSIPYLFLVLFTWASSLLLYSQPAGYYASADGKTGMVLQKALHDIVNNQIVLSYADLWTAFQKTDKKSDGKVWDMYSDIPGGTPAYLFVFGQNQCGNYSKEGDCYNREHTFPKSWFNDLSPMYTDLNHLVPTDGWVNNKRGNYPFGVTSSPTWTSTNGSKVGPSSCPGYSGIVFEPVNGYKGDFARIILYMAIRYYGEDTGWPGSDMVTGSQPKEWALKMLMEWSKNDPVSQKEKDRNDSVYAIQHNRNPLIDNAVYADLIWGTQSVTGKLLSEKESFRIYPNPASESITLEGQNASGSMIAVTVSDISGKAVLKMNYSEYPVNVNVKNLPQGLYIIVINRDGKIIRERIIVSR